MALVHEKRGTFYLGSIFERDIDRDGNVTYLRDAWQDHEDYLIDDHKKRGANTHKI